MPATSEARILANRASSSKSTGPSTPGGREISRRNSLKHGMTGRGIVIPEADMAAVEERKIALQAEFAPRTVMGMILVGQMATLSIRMERGAEQEFAAVAARRRHAVDDFDESRIDEAEGLFDRLGDDPRGNLRRLRKSPEGIDVLIREWLDLRADLTFEGKPLWTPAHLARAANLTGLRDDQARGSRIGVLSRAIRGEAEALADLEGAGQGVEARKAWALARLVERIDREIADLEEDYENLDFEAIDKDRAGARARAQFDPSKEACLARRYEAEARRGFFKAYEELKKVEKEAAERVEAVPDPAPAPASEESEITCEPLASFRESPPRAPRAMPSDALWPVAVDASSGFSIARGPDGQPVRIGKASQGSA